MTASSTAASAVAIKDSRDAEICGSSAHYPAAVIPNANRHHCEARALMPTAISSAVKSNL